MLLKIASLLSLVGDRNPFSPFLLSYAVRAPWARGSIRFVAALPNCLATTEPLFICVCTVYMYVIEKKKKRKEFHIFSKCLSRPVIYVTCPFFFSQSPRPSFYPIFSPLCFFLVSPRLPSQCKEQRETCTRTAESAWNSGIVTRCSCHSNFVFSASRRPEDGEEEQQQQVRWSRTFFYGLLSYQDGVEAYIQYMYMHLWAVCLSFVWLRHMTFLFVSHNGHMSHHVSKKKISTFSSFLFTGKHVSKYIRPANKCCLAKRSNDYVLYSLSHAQMLAIFSICFVDPSPSWIHMSIMSRRNKLRFQELKSQTQPSPSFQLQNVSMFSVQNLQFYRKHLHTACFPPAEYATHKETTLFHSQFTVYTCITETQRSIMHAKCLFRLYNNINWSMLFLPFFFVSRSFYHFELFKFYLFLGERISSNYCSYFSTLYH